MKEDLNQLGHMKEPFPTSYACIHGCLNTCKSQECVDSINYDQTPEVYNNGCMRCHFQNICPTYHAHLN